MNQLFPLIRLGAMGGLLVIAFRDYQGGDLANASLALALVLLAGRG
jgi:hypothetical protein